VRADEVRLLTVEDVAGIREDLARFEDEEMMLVETRFVRDVAHSLEVLQAENERLKRENQRLLTEIDVTRARLHRQEMVI